MAEIDDVLQVFLSELGNQLLKDLFIFNCVSVLNMINLLSIIVEIKELLDYREQVRIVVLILQLLHKFRLFCIEKFESYVIRFLLQLLLLHQT